jgi:hypothetical protein
MKRYDKKDVDGSKLKSRVRTLWKSMSNVSHEFAYHTRRATPEGMENEVG